MTEDTEQMRKIDIVLYVQKKVCSPKTFNSERYAKKKPQKIVSECAI